MTTNLPDPADLDALGPAFLGLGLAQLLGVIDGQGSELLTERGIDLPSRLVSSLVILRRNGPTSVTELGQRLGMSHQLVAHRIKALRDAKLVQHRADPKDGRRQLLRLSRRGEEVVAQLDLVFRDAEAAYADLFEEIGVDLFQTLLDAKRALTRLPIRERAAARARS